MTLRKKLTVSLRGAGKPFLILMALVLVAIPVLPAALSPTPARAAPATVHLSVDTPEVGQGGHVDLSWWIEGPSIFYDDEVRLIIRDPAGLEVYQEEYRSLGSIFEPVTESWEVPSDAALGEYTARLEYWLLKPWPFTDSREAVGAASFTVVETLPINLTVDPTEANRGDTVECSWWVGRKYLYIEWAVRVEFEIVDPAGTVVMQEEYGWDGVGSASDPVVVGWDVPGDAITGVYTVRVRLYGEMDGSRLVAEEEQLFAVEAELPTFDYDVSVSPLDDGAMVINIADLLEGNVGQIEEEFAQVSVNLEGGDPEDVALACELQDPNPDIELSVSPDTGQPDFAARIRATVTGQPSTGSYSFTVTASSEWVEKSASGVLSLFAGPEITDFTPQRGWAGITVTIEGENLASGTVYLGDHPDPVGYIGEPTGGTFVIPEDAPHGNLAITVQCPYGQAQSVDTLEIFARPDYCLNWGFQFPNQSDDFLTYPQLPWDDGDYKDCFGWRDVYYTIWVCVGVPYWSPWSGWGCLGYEIEEPVCPDLIAEVFYWAAFWWLGRLGECFGMSAASLMFANGEVEPNEFDATATRVNELDRTPLDRGLDHLIDYMHGSQVSMDCLLRYLEWGVGGVSSVVSEVRNAIDAGEYGIISVIHGFGGHAMVPYLVEDIDENTTRIYVYDPNREQFSNETTALDALLNWGPANNYPPYIEIDRSGVGRHDLWTWSFEHSDGDVWGGWYGSNPLFFVPYETLLDRTLPVSLLDLDDLLEYVIGDAIVQIEDDEGRRLGIDEQGDMITEIPGAIPIPAPEVRGYTLPFDNYTSHITGQADGSYSWYDFAGSCSAHAIEDADVAAGSEDTVTLSYQDSSLLGGHMSFETSDSSKTYSAALIRQCPEGKVQRAYRVRNTTIHGGSVATFATSSDFESLIYTNNGPHTVTYDVEFQTNMVSEEIADEGLPTSTPTAIRTGITIGPYETHVLTPDNWLDLDQSAIDIEATQMPTPEAVTPSSGEQGETLDAVIAGNNFTAASSAGFGSGITVNSFTVDSDTQITANITIAADAATGARDVSVTTPDGTGTLPDGFIVEASSAPPTPTLAEVSHSSGNQGETLDTVITGTGFNGTSDVSFGSGITVNSFTVDSDTQITANITIAADAATGARDVSVTTAGGTGTLPDGFIVEAAEVEPAGDEAGLRAWVWVLVALAIVGAAVGTIVFVLRRRRAAA